MTIGCCIIGADSVTTVVVVIDCCYGFSSSGVGSGASDTSTLELLQHLFQMQHEQITKKHAPKILPTTLPAADELLAEIVMLPKVYVI